MTSRGQCCICSQNQLGVWIVWWWCLVALESEMEYSRTQRLDTVPPISTGQVHQILIGQMRGIQGHCNSCYMDAALFRSGWLTLCAFFEEGKIVFVKCLNPAQLTSVSWTSFPSAWFKVPLLTQKRLTWQVQWTKKVTISIKRGGLTHCQELAILVCSIVEYRQTALQSVQIFPRSL